VNLNQPVNEIALLGILKNLCILFNCPSDNKQETLLGIKRTAGLMTALYYLDKDDNYQLSTTACKNLLAKGQAFPEGDDKNFVLNCANALKTALYILESEKPDHCHAWKTALRTKLKETRQMLNKKASHLERKMKKSSDTPTAGLFARQKNIEGVPSKKLKVSSQGVQEKSGLDIEQAKENVLE